MKNKIGEVAANNLCNEAMYFIGIGNYSSIAEYYSTSPCLEISIKTTIHRSKKLKWITIKAIQIFN